MLTEYCTALDISSSALTDRQRTIAYDQLAQLPKHARKRDTIATLTRYMLTLWQYRNPVTLKMQHVVDAFAIWDADGRPVSADDNDLVHTGTDTSTIDTDERDREIDRRRRWRESRGLEPTETMQQAAARAAARRER